MKYMVQKLRVQFEFLSKKLFGDYLYCHFIEFGNLGPTLERRIELRKSLVERLKISFGHFKKDWEKLLLIPGEPPIIPDISISISHCPLMGGFVFSFDKKTSIGFDIEISDRVDRAIEYLSTYKEIKEAPEKSLLWVAKESVFKCIPLKEEKHFLRDSLIFNWNEIDGGGYKFKFYVEKKKIMGKGLAFLVGKLGVGYAQTRACPHFDYLHF